MKEFRQEQQQTVVVASFQTTAEAELVRLNLVANGVQAVVVAPASQYPSIDFVEGVDVQVSAADAEAAREILRKLDRPGT
jgi:hypothetical protein